MFRISMKSQGIAGHPKAALLFGFFGGGVRYIVWLFIALLVRYKNRK